MLSPPDPLRPLNGDHSRNVLLKIDKLPLRIMVPDDEMDLPVKTPKKLAGLFIFIVHTEEHVSQAIDRIFLWIHTVPVFDQSFIHLLDVFKAQLLPDKFTVVEKVGV